MAQSVKRKETSKKFFIQQIQSHKSSQMWRQKGNMGKYLCFLTEQFQSRFTVSDNVFRFTNIISEVMLRNILEP